MDDGRLAVVQTLQAFEYFLEYLTPYEVLDGLHGRVCVVSVEDGVDVTQDVVQIGLAVLHLNVNAFLVFHPNTVIVDDMRMVLLRETLQLF